MKLAALLALARQVTHAPWKPTNLRESVRKELYIEIMKIKRNQVTEPSQTCAQVFPLLQAMKILYAKAAVENEWEKLEKIPACQLTEVRNEEDVITEAKKAKLFILLHQWISVISRIRSWNQNIKITKVKSCSEVIQ